MRPKYTVLLALLSDFFDVESIVCCVPPTAFRFICQVVDSTNSRRSPIKACLSTLLFSSWLQSRTFICENFLLLSGLSLFNGRFPLFPAFEPERLFGNLAAVRSGQLSAWFYGCRIALDSLLLLVYLQFSHFCLFGQRACYLCRILRRNNIGWTCWMRIFVWKIEPI